MRRLPPAAMAMKQSDKAPKALAFALCRLFWIGIIFQGGGDNALWGDNVSAMLQGPVFLTAKQTVRLKVPLVGQKAENAVHKGYMECWYAAACMVAYYFEVGPRLGLPEIWKADLGLTAESVRKLAKVEGLETPPRHSITPTKAELLTILKTYGPLWAAGHYLEEDSRAAHAIVVTGVDASYIYYNDPWEPKAKEQSYHWFVRNLLPLRNALLVRRPTPAHK